MKRTTLVTVPATIGGRPLTVIYRVTVVVEAGGDRFHTAWGYAEAVPVQLSAERQFDIAIDLSGGSSRTGDRWA